MSSDAKLRSWLLGTVVTILMTVVGCVAEQTYSKVSALESENTTRKVENATIKQDLQDFRQSFEEFKNDVKADLQRHHK